MKRLLIALVAAVAVSTGFARIEYTQGFETDDRSAFVSDGASGEDASAPVAYDQSAMPTNTVPYNFSDYGSKYFELDTGDATVWYTNECAAPYFDMVMQFNPSASAPDIDEGTKIAVYVNANSNLVIVAGDEYTGRNTYTTAHKLPPGTWARLTISANGTQFAVYLDGQKIDDYYPLVGDVATINSIGFKGSGALDDFVARTTDPFIQNPAATIGGEGYASFDDALDDADANATIVLNGNASLSSAVAKAITIDVNGNTLSSTALQPNVSIVDGAVTHGTVALTDASVETTRMTGESVTLLASLAGATLTVNGNAVASATLPGYVAKVGTTGFDTVAAAAAAVAADTVSGDVELLQTPTATVAVGSSATIDLKGLTVTAAGASAFSISDGAVVTIKNGTVTAGYLAAFTSGTLNVQSGTYTLSTAIAADENGTIAISGGSFNMVVAANQCAAGYAPRTIADGGWYTVLPLAENRALYSTYGNAAYSLDAKNANAYWQAFTLSRASTAAAMPTGVEGNCYLFNIAGDNLAANYAGVSLKSISVVWGGNLDANAEIGKSGLSVQPDAYLVTTLEDDTIVAISAANDVKWSANGTSTFAFNGEYLNSATAYRAQFVTNVAGLAVGEKLTDAVRGRVNMRYHYSKDNSREDSTTACSAANTYSANITIVVEAAVASVDGVYYPTLEAAIDAAAAAGKTVMLNCANDESVTIPSNVTLDLNGYSATGTISGGGRIVGASSSTPLVDFGSWTGTFVVSWDPNGSFKFNNYGVSGSTVEIGTWSGFQDIADIASLTVNPAVKVTTSMTMNNGYTGSGNKTTFAAISGNGALNFTKKLGSDDLYYAINKLDGSNVVLTVNNGGWNQVTPDQKRHTYVTIGGVNLAAEPSIGVKVVQVALDEYCDLRNDADEGAKAGAGFGVTIADVPSETMLVYDSDGLYVAVASVTANDATTYYKTIDAAAIAALNASTNEFTLLRTEAGTTLPNWIYDAETGKFIKDSSVASIGDTKYETLAEAISDAGPNDTITLLSSISDPISLNKTITLDAGGYVCTGALSGNGTLVLVRDAQMTFGEWSGTVVVDWDASGGRIKPDRYGIAGSTVRYARALTAGYFNINDDKDGAPSIAPAVYFADDVTINNGFSGEGARTTFAKVGMASGKTFKTRNGGSYYTFTVLEGFEGTIEVRGTAHVTVGTVVRAAAPVADECVVKVTKGANAVLDGLSSVKVQVGDAAPVDMPMVFTTLNDEFDVPVSGLYKAVAKIGPDNYYATFGDAVAAYQSGNQIDVLDQYAGNVPAGWEFNPGCTELVKVQVTLTVWHDEQATAAVTVGGFAQTPTANYTNYDEYTFDYNTEAVVTWSAPEHYKIETGGGFDNPATFVLTENATAQAPGNNVVRDTVLITLPIVENTTMAVTATSGDVVKGVEYVADVCYTVDNGATVTITYTADDGYKITGTSFYTIESAYEGATIDASATVVTVDSGSTEIQPGQTDGKEYASQQEAEAALSNVTPTAATEVSTALGEEATAAYLTKFEAKVVGNGDGTYKVVVGLKAEAEAALADDATTNVMATVAASLSDIVADATGDKTEVTVSNVVPGFYYSISYGTELGAMNTEGDRVLAPVSGTIKLQTPAKEESAAAGFYRVNVNVTDK